MTFISPTLTKHAQTRMQQRAVDPDMVSFIIHMGKAVEQKGGTTKYRIGKKEARRLKKILDRSTGKSVIVSETDNVVITVQHGL